MSDVIVNHTQRYTVWKRCNDCGTMNNERKSYCRECGNPLLTQSKTDQPGPL